VGECKTRTRSYAGRDCFRVARRTALGAPEQPPPLKQTGSVAPAAASQRRSSRASAVDRPRVCALGAPRTPRRVVLVQPRRVQCICAAARLRTQMADTGQRHARAIFERCGDCSVPALFPVASTHASHSGSFCERALAASEGRRRGTAWETRTHRGGEERPRSACIRRRQALAPLRVLRQGFKGPGFGWALGVGGARGAEIHGWWKTAVQAYRRRWVLCR
jgi:hypothetical protein